MLKNEFFIDRSVDKTACLETVFYQFGAFLLVIPSGESFYLLRLVEICHFAGFGKVLFHRIIKSRYEYLDKNFFRLPAYVGFACVRRQFLPGLCQLRCG